MDRSCKDPGHVGTSDDASRPSSSESESDRDDGSDTSSTTGGEIVDDPTPQADGENADEDEDDVDSDVETERIGDSVLRFARRCVTTGEFAKAMTALMNVVEISDLDAVPCRQALLFAAQVFVATNQEAKAIECMLEIWDSMPPPYTNQDARLLLAVIYERLEHPRFAIYWFKKAFVVQDGVRGSFPPSRLVELVAWHALAEKSYDQGDFVVSVECYTRAFACIFQTQAWPLALSVFRFVGRFLSAVTSVAHLRPDRQSYRQQIAYSLAVAMVHSDALSKTPLADRAFDEDYLLLRRVYAASFPSIYDYLFRQEDSFVGRITRAWRVWQARQARKRAIVERERDRREAAAEADAASEAMRAKKKKTKAPKKILPVDGDNRDELHLRVLRQRTKARIQSLRTTSSSISSPPPVRKKVPKSRPAERELEPKDEILASPTRRKLETVKRSRDTTNMQPVAINEETLRGNQRPACSESAPLTSLLDLYSFPPLATHRRAFEADAGRAQGAADLDDDELNEIEAFARMAHYRSRVIRQQHAPIQDVERVTPQWLARFNDVVQFIQTHQQTTTKSYFSEIHARVVLQLSEIHTKYRLQHGTTTFTIQLAKTLRRVETWEFTRVDAELLPQLHTVRAIGEREETQRNLEFYHVSTKQHSTAGKE